MMLTTSPADALADRVALSMFSHGLGLSCLRPRAIFSFSHVDVEDLDLDLLVDLEHLGRVIDAVPAHVGDVQQTVDAAQVDERAEVGDVLDHALASLADLDLGHQLLLASAALFFDELAPADDDVAAIGVDLEDLGLRSRADVLADVAGRRMSTCEAGRKTGTPMSTSSPPLILRITGL
jgi:hypothetical protein